MMTFPRTAGTGVTQHQQHMRCSRETGWHGFTEGALCLKKSTRCMQPAYAAGDMVAFGCSPPPPFTWAHAINDCAYSSCDYH